MRWWSVRLVHAVWGFPQTVAGACGALVFARCRRHAYRMACVTEWPLERGLSLGLFVFVPRGCARPLLVHEYGHSVQSLLLGPLYIPVIVLPSLVWAGVPRLSRWRHVRQVSYYGFYTERWANWLGERFCQERSMGQALVD